jgi:hypothetical protein
MARIRPLASQDRRFKPDAEATASYVYHRARRVFLIMVLGILGAHGDLGGSCHHCVMFARRTPTHPQAPRSVCRSADRRAAFTTKGIREHGINDRGSRHARDLGAVGSVRRTHSGGERWKVVVRIRVAEGLPSGEKEVLPVDEGDGALDGRFGRHQNRPKINNPAGAFQQVQRGGITETVYQARPFGQG